MVTVVDDNKAENKQGDKKQRNLQQVQRNKHHLKLCS